MSDREGVIKYRLDHRFAMLDHAIDIGEIDAWRSVFYRLQLIGQSAERYHGLGFGNISVRLAKNRGFFLISGTQTGHLPKLNRSDFTIVESASPEANYLQSAGPCQPSSEALTHAAVYRQTRGVNAVIHVHSPEIWRNTATLNLPRTSAAVAYGSVEMATAVGRLMEENTVTESGVFSMLGHEDGIVAMGTTISEASWVLLKTLSDAIRVEQSGIDH